MKIAAFTYDEFGGGVIINWGDERLGFGQIYMDNKDGKLHFAAEGMSKDFIKEVLNQLVDESETS